MVGIIKIAKIVEDDYPEKKLVKANHVCSANKLLEICFVDQTKSCLSYGENVKSEICGTKPNHVCAAYGMLEVAWWYKDKSYLWRGRNVKSWLCG